MHADTLYLAWVAREVQYALGAHDRLVASLANGDHGVDAADDFLIHCARVSRLVRAPARPGRGEAWKGREEFKDLRRQQLAHLLHVPAPPPSGRQNSDEWVLGSRTVRDSSDHFDERIDTFVMAWSPPTADEVESGTADWTLWTRHMPWRRVDRDPLRIHVAGNVVNVEPMAEELRRLAAVMDELGVLMDNPPDFPLAAFVPPWPRELRLDAPTRRPHEHVTTRPVINSADIAGADEAPDTGA